MQAAASGAGKWGQRQKCQKKTAPWWVLTVVGGKADHKHPSASAVIPALGTRFFCGGNLNGGTLAEVL